MRKNFINEYFSFSRKERIGIYILLTLIVVVSILPNFYHYFIHQKTYDSSAFDRELAELTIQEGDSSETNPLENGYTNKNYIQNRYQKTSAESFMFDPNTASEDEWKQT